MEENNKIQLILYSRGGSISLISLDAARAQKPKSKISQISAEFKMP